MPLPAIFLSEKTIPGPLQWSVPSQSDGYIRIYTPLEIDGVLEAGTVLIGGAYAHHPERHVTFELAVLNHHGRRRVRLARVDWRDLTGGHSNQRHKCPDATERRVGETHLHSFEANWVEAERKMKKGKLPCAETIKEDLQSFKELRAYVGRVFRINNIDIVPPPNWEYNLFS